MKIVDKFLAMSLPWRIILSVLMMFLAGPALIGLISEYATYWYALNESVRLPVEGIPYLSATVTFVSFLLALSVSFTFLLSRLIIGYFVGNVITSFEDSTKLPTKIINLIKKFILFDSNPIEKALDQINTFPTKFREIKPKSIIIIAIIFGVISFGLSYWKFSDREDVEAINVAILMSAYFVLIILTLWRKFIMHIVSFIVALSFYIFSISLLFNHQYYSNFLTLTGFGGGQSIIIQLKTDEKPIVMKLVIRSKDWFIGHSLSNGESIEVPQHVVKSITYEKVTKNSY